MKKPAYLYLLRHPQTQAGPATCYGSSDVQVSPQARREALRRLLPVLPGGLPVYSSPRSRCMDMAHALADQLGSGPVIEDARLVEIDFGNWEMQPWDDVPRDQLDAWASAPATYHPGGGESLYQMALRVLAFYRDLLAQRRDAIVVCHGGTIKMLQAWQERCDGGLPMAGPNLIMAGDQQLRCRGDAGEASWPANWPGPATGRSDLDERSPMALAAQAVALCCLSRQAVAYGACVRLPLRDCAGKSEGR